MPVGRSVAPGDVAAGAPFYPLVGAGLGALAALVASLELPPLVAAALGAALLAALTGALHLDALADTADGLAGRTPEERLRIMRDHAVGAYGAAALVLALVLEVALVASLVETEDVLAALVGACACSRGAILPVAVALPDARARDAISTRITIRGAALGVLAAVAVAWLVGGLVALAAAFAVATLACVLLARRLGGVTGDVLGAGVQLAELAALTAFVAAG